MLLVGLSTSVMPVPSTAEISLGDAEVFTELGRLAAQDPAALAKWLTDNGFPQPDGIDANLAPYVADHRMDTTSVPVAGNRPTLVTGLALLAILGVGGVMIVIALIARRVPAEHRLS